MCHAILVLKKKNKTKKVGTGRGVYITEAFFALRICHKMLYRIFDKYTQNLICVMQKYSCNACVEAPYIPPGDLIL